MKTWQLQEAKANLSKLVKAAAHSGPQEITLRGESAVVVIAKNDYDKLIQPKLSLVNFIQQSPLYKANLNIKRDRSLTRDIDL